MAKIIKHRGKLKDTTSQINWEIPENTTGVFVYLLTGGDSHDVRYVGITTSPETRLSHHICDRGKTYKTAWIKSVLKRGELLKMNIVASYPTYKEALIHEEALIALYNKTVTNYELKPTTPSVKQYFLYDFIEDTWYTLPSRTSASKFIGSSTVNQTGRIRGRYFLTKSSSFEKLIEDFAVIKLKKDNCVKYAFSQKHAAILAGVSVGTVNACINGYRRVGKGWIFSKIDAKFQEYPGRGKRIECLNDGKKFDELKLAAIHYKVDPSMITKICKGKRPAVKGLKFKYV